MPAAWVQIVVYLALLLALGKAFGEYMARVYEGRPLLLERVLGPLECGLYRLAGPQATGEMTWRTYAVAVLILNLLGLLVVYALQRLQGDLPGNPEHLSAVPAALGLNTAASFASNTNWQSYSGETTLSYLTQMLGLTVQNFLSAATGMAVLAALIRGLTRRTARTEIVPSTSLRRGDLFLAQAGDLIAADGEVIAGIAMVDESAVTGESAPVVRESGGDRSAVTGGTRIISDWLVVQVSASPGEGFLDRMISLVEGAKRQKTPNEIALSILLAGFTIIFLVVCGTLLPSSLYAVRESGQGHAISITVLVALLVCLIPTTIGGLLSAIGIAGMERLIQRNVIATSGRAVEAAGDVDVLLLDKTGTITLGNREAVDFLPVDGVPERELAEAAQLSSLADETPEGRSIVELAKIRFGLRGRPLGAGQDVDEAEGMRFVPFSAQTRMSGVDLDGTRIRKGAPDAMFALLESRGRPVPSQLRLQVEGIARAGGTPLVVARDGQPLGVVHLKDIVKGGIRDRFAHLRRMGIKTVMITGDNPLTAAAIAAEAGVDDFLAEATPEAKLRLIRDYQTGGRLVAMTGDGTNDAPALAQGDVAVAMNTGTQPAREAANMVDLDSNPTKLIDIVEIGKQLLMTRGALTTFSIANDVSKYFAIIPAAFASTYPALQALNFMRLATPESAILSAVIFNALIIVALIPLALRGVPYRPVGAAQLLRDNLLLYGAGGLVAPFIAIKLIDLLLVVFHLA